MDEATFHDSHVNRPLIRMDILWSDGISGSRLLEARVQHVNITYHDWNQQNASTGDEHVGNRKQGSPQLNHRRIAKWARLAMILDWPRRADGTIDAFPPAGLWLPVT
jgi:hypothetical protein